MLNGFSDSFCDASSLSGFELSCLLLEGSGLGGKLLGLLSNFGGCLSHKVLFRCCETPQTG